MNIKNSSFTLNTSNQDFVQRQKNVFDQLNNLETKLQQNPNPSDMEIDTDPSPKSNNKPHKSLSKHYKGRESIFKRPQDPLTRKFMRKVPDFKKNPHKWTKYTLDDVKDEDMSDKSNTKAAYSFLNELRKRNLNSECETDMKSDDDNSGKILFKKVVKHNNNRDKSGTEDAKASFASSKVVMPEYVVGEKPLTKPKKIRQIKEKSGTQLKLNHLYEEDE